MRVLANGELQPVIDKLEKLSHLDDGDRRALMALPTTIIAPPAGTALIREGCPAKSFYALLDGFAYRSRDTADGRRQIICFHMPGDLFDLALLLNETSDNSIVTIGQTRVAAIASEALATVKRERPNIADAFWRDTLLDATIYKEWVVNLGQRDAQTRIAHMLSEFLSRRAVTMPNARQLHMLPFNQAHIAAATGLTPVHVNRMLKVLEERGALSRHQGHVVLNDPAELTRISGFDPGYLQPALAKM